MMKKFIIVIAFLLTALSAKAQYLPEMMLLQNTDSTQVQKYLTIQQYEYSNKIKVDKVVTWTGVGITSAGALITILAAAEVFDREDWPWIVGPTLAGCGAITTTVGGICWGVHSKRLKQITLAKSGFGFGLLF